MERAEAPAMPCSTRVSSAPSSSRVRVWGLMAALYALLLAPGPQSGARAVGGGIGIGGLEPALVAEQRTEHGVGHLHADAETPGGLVVGLAHPRPPRQRTGH